MTKDLRICTEVDNFILEWMEWKPRWIATLENGRQVFQDDERYSVDGKRDSSWLRLANYCKQNKTYLKNLRIDFRGNGMNFPDRGTYLLSLGAGGSWGSNLTDSFFIVGCPLFNKPNYLSQTWIKTPEMSVTRTEDISLEEIKQGDFASGLIEKN